MRRLVPLLLLLLVGCVAAPAAVFSGEFTNARGKFIVCGDSRGPIMDEWLGLGSGRVRRAIFARLAEEEPDFILNNGDLVAAGGLSSLWRGFDDETSELRARGIAYLPVLGNHDLWPTTAGGLANWFARFPFLGASRWYVARYGYVDVIVVDSNADHLTDAQVAEQAAWFRASIAAADEDPSVRCVVVACHHSPLTNCFVHGSAEWVRAQFVEPARASPKVKAFFTGHVHSYEHFVENGVHFVVSGGGGAPLMHVDGPSGKLPDLYDGPRGHHFCRVIPRKDRVDVEVVMMDDDLRWSVADAWSIALP